MTIAKNPPKPPRKVGTTGHEWDGIQELNTPLPRWWLWLFYATIVWSIGYWIVYPAWPLVSSYSNGLFNWHTRSAVATQLAAAAGRARPDDGAACLGLAASRSRRRRNCSISPARWAGAPSPTIARRATAPAAAAPGAIPISTTTIGCGAARSMQIAQTIRHGARAGDDDGHQGSMPAFGRDGLLKPDEISTVADYVRSLSGLPTDAWRRSGGAARKSSPTIAPSVTARKAKAIASSARPT